MRGRRRVRDALRPGDASESVVECEGRNRNAGPGTGMRLRSERNRAARLLGRLVRVATHQRRRPMALGRPSHSISVINIYKNYPPQFIKVSLSRSFM